ncbi:MAG: hypothetical protein ACR2OC_00485 [Solirubrobacterales bacterium]
MAAALVLASCGNEESADEPRPVETADVVPDLPPGWSVERNADAGFAIGVPPGWQARNEGISMTLRSPDRLVAATVVADRSDEAIEAQLDELAETTITAVAGIRDLEPGDTRKFGHRYEAVAIEAKGVGGKRDIRQEFLLVVVRREDLATFTVLVAGNAEQDTNGYDTDIERMIRSLRSRSVG